jgi:hypothetical protein
MIRQDSNDPEGVSGDPRPPRVSPAGKIEGKNSAELLQARNRKADAALSMAIAGANWSEIAQALGYPTPRMARVATEKALERDLHSESSQVAMRELAGAKLDRLLRSVWKRAINEEDPDQVSYVREARSLVADWRKLFGTDAPSEVVVTSPSMVELEKWVAGMVASQVPQLEEGDIFDVVEGEVVSDTDDEEVIF